MGSRLVDVDGGLGSESHGLVVQLEEAMGEEEGHVAVIHLRDVRCPATLTSRLGVVLLPVALAAVVEADIVAGWLAITASAYCLPSLFAAIAVALFCLGLLLPSTTWTPTMLCTR